MKKHAQGRAPVVRQKMSATALAADAVMSARLRAGLTQTELAEKVGTSQKGIGRLESGEHNATIQTLERVAKATSSVLDVRIRPKKKA